MLSEKMNSRALTTSMNCFDSLIRDLELYDPPLSNAKFTWPNLRVSPICCRLDIFLFLGGWLGGNFSLLQANNFNDIRSFFSDPRCFKGKVGSVTF